MNKLLVVVLVAMGSGVFPSTVLGLNCKVCYVDTLRPDPAANSCATMPCDKSDDLQKAAQAYLKSSGATDEDAIREAQTLRSTRLGRGATVCFRAVQYEPDRSSVISQCAQGPPEGTVPYPRSGTYGPDHPNIKRLGERIQNYARNGQLYVCNQTIGYGTNCGADPDLTVPPLKSQS